MTDKQQLSIKLQEAFNKGFVPAEVRQYMNDNNHSGQVWIVDQEDTMHQVYDKKTQLLREEPLERIGIGYRLAESSLGANDGDSHVLIYTLPEIEEILREVR